ncbi:hypothetical protein Daura_46485 [Dactylosporangium aurantiacum]|uniref:DUF6884 domain-containing protein n=1 Tax=Dactylosporangium aurantiacum TaxID=35754 RepID=A0A9Q9IFW4_9ACTN|nr:DUF6884 domain-containing protein [Dactylosporangium aurantiacum]MDG6108326.1 hypothetical protein [Dactylosporangium aurantiacum]UWZ53868.1 hypothetical protein Daura_46485 [Dactylosporangium aurantiacum]
MTGIRDNHSCHAAAELHPMTAHLADLAAQVPTAQTPSAALAALAALEDACREAREWLVVDLVLNDGWSFAELGRALGVTRQAASKAYAAPVEQRMRHNLRSRDTALVVVACGGAKLDRPAPAADLYVGSYHQACRRAAERLGGRLVILSARYGLLMPHTVIAPYEQRMGQPGAVAVATLRAQARRLGLDTAGDVTVLGGREYADAASAVWPHARRPLDDARGIGPQMRALAELARTATTTVAPQPEGLAA